MNIFQEPYCSILGVLLFVLLHGLCADPDAEVVHKAVGDSLELIAGYQDILEVKWTYNEIEFAEYQIGESVQHPTKIIALHVHDRITGVQIEYSDSWSQSQNSCTFHLRCLASGDPNPSYSWTGHQDKTEGQHLNINLHPAESATLNCTANNTISVKYTTETVMCIKKSNDSSTSPGAGFPQNYLLIAVGVCIVVVILFGGAVAACCRWKKNKGQGESEADITVYEDVNTEVNAKKRSESVVNGMSIYETVDETKCSQKLPQTLYDKINYQRHPAVSANTSSPYQEVL
ncbi:hypothetical protein Q8A67_001690 [Cirrhinus molitorella]|uniref:Ig-like domain-containing protein n=1 Tax=Cirrhinus molitorella TaxID=172907 RepID=A0AA88Q517_9TELE|nr:hypothetical protein Q8A67_001690 [Cirrhinus molitorella]